MRRRKLACEKLEPRMLLAVIAAEHDGVAYFVRPESPRIERYDVAGHAWLASVELAGATTAPTALAVDGSGIFVAFSNAVYRYAANGNSRTHLLTAGTPANDLLLDGSLLFVNASTIYEKAVTTINTTTNAVVGSFTNWWVDALHGASIVPGANRIFGRTAGVSPSDIAYLSYGDNGVITGGSDSPYHGDLPDASQTWVLPGDALVIDDSGTIYRTANLTRAASLGTRIDDIAFRQDGTPVSLRGSKLAAYDSKFLPTAETDLGYVPDEILGSGDSVVAFTADPGSSHGFRDEVVPPSRFTPPAPGPAVDPASIAYSPDAVTVAADGTLLIFDRETASVFRWDPAAARYTQSLPLIGSPQFFAYSPTTDSAYLAEASGFIRRLEVSAASPQEKAFAVLAAPPGGLATAGAYLFAQDSSGAWATHSTFAPNGALVDSKDWNHYSEEFIWSDANQRMYFFQDNFSPNDLLSEEINADGTSYPGELPGGIGFLKDSPLHTSVGFEHPLRVAPDGSVVVLGSGLIHDARSLARLPYALSNPVADATWLAGSLYTLRVVAGGTEVQRWNGPTYELVASATIPGVPVRLVTAGDSLVALTAGGASALAFAQFDANLAVLGPAPVVASIGDATVTEGDDGTRRAIFPVKLSRPSDEPVLVAYGTVDGTATSGRDFREKHGFVTFQPGETLKNVSIRTIGDRVHESDESFSVALQSATNATIGRDVAKGTILNDDPRPRLTIRDVSVLEGNGAGGTATFVLRLSAPSELPVRVAFAAVGKTAAAGDDFQPVFGTAIIEPGSTVTKVRVPVTGDTTFESDENFMLKLTALENVMLDRVSAKGTIRNDDPKPKLSVANARVAETVSGIAWAAFTITLSAAAGVPVSIHYTTADGTARAGVDYAATSGTLTFAPGETSKVVSIAILADAAAEPSERFALRLSTPVGAKLDRARAEATILDAGPVAKTLAAGRWRSFP